MTKDLEMLLIMGAISKEQYAKLKRLEK